MIIGKVPPPYYGTTVWTKTLMESSLREKFDIIFFNANLHSSISTLGKKDPRKIFSNIRLFFELSRDIKLFKPELILIPISQETIGFLKDSVFIHIAGRSKIKILVMLHGSNMLNWLKESNNFVRWYFRNTMVKAIGAIVLGHSLRYLFSDYFASENIYIVPNGADYHFPDVKRIVQSKIRIIYLGNLLPGKGIYDIIKGISLLPPDIMDRVCMDVVGSWAEKKTRIECMNMVAREKLPIVFRGPAYDTEKLDFLKNAEIFVFAPRMPEGHPYVIIEAMAAGLPIISTNQGAIPESVIDGKNGFIVETCNPKQIAEKIEFLIKHPQIREKMGRESRHLYEENFTEEKMIKRLCRVFNTVLEER